MAGAPKASRKMPESKTVEGIGVLTPWLEQTTHLSYRGCRLAASCAALLLQRLGDQAAAHVHEAGDLGLVAGIRRSRTGATSVEKRAADGLELCLGDQPRQIPRGPT